MSLFKPAAVVVAATVLMVSGCASGSSTTTAPPAATTSPTASAAAGAGSAPSPDATTAKPDSGGQAAAAIARCRSTDLKVTWTADQGGGAAGSQGSFLIFTNTTSKTCSLYGYPGVSFVAGDQGTQVGDAFTRSEAAKKTVNVSAGGSAHAQIVTVNWQNYSEGDCKPVSVRGFRVYPPDETAAVFVSQPQTACSAKNKGVGQVFPIVAGQP